MTLNDKIQNQQTWLTFFAFRSYKVGFAFANVGSKEWRANASVEAFANFATTGLDIKAFIIVTGRSNVSRNASRISSQFNQIFQGIPIDYKPLQGPIQACHDARVFIQTVRISGI